MFNFVIYANAEKILNVQLSISFRPALTLFIHRNLVMSFCVSAESRLWFYITQFFPFKLPLFNIHLSPQNSFVRSQQGFFLSSELCNSNLLQLYTLYVCHLKLFDASQCVITKWLKVWLHHLTMAFWWCLSLAFYV